MMGGDPGAGSGAGGPPAAVVVVVVPVPVPVPVPVEAATPAAPAAPAAGAAEAGAETEETPVWASLAVAAFMVVLLGCIGTWIYFLCTAASIDYSHVEALSPTTSEYLALHMQPAPALPPAMGPPATRLPTFVPSAAGAGAAAVSCSVLGLAGLVALLLV